MTDYFLNEDFYQRVDQLKGFFQRLVRCYEDTDTINKAITGIRELDENIATLGEQELAYGPNIEMRRILLSSIMGDLLQLYSLRGREQDLDFDFFNVSEVRGYTLKGLD